MRKDRQRKRATQSRGLLLERLEDRTLLSSVPTGVVDTFSRSAIMGYAYNKDDGQLPMTVMITVNGVTTTLTASDYRANIITKVGSPYHAFSFTMPTLPAGNSTVTVQAVSPTTGMIKTIKTGVIANPPPKGKVEYFSVSQIRGYAVDTDTKSPIQIRIDIDGVAGTPFFTDIPRPDLDSKIGGGYTSPGFNVAGNFAGHVVEVYGIDTPSGVKTLLFTNNHAPIGKVEVNNGFTVSGWALDSDSGSSSSKVKVTIDGVALSGGPFTANLQRDDLVAKYGSGGHGFSIAIPGLTPGTHVINVYALDGQANSAAPVLIGTAKVTDNAPRAKLDTITNTSTLTGYAFDKDIGATASSVNVYVDEQFYRTVTANITRTDIKSISPTLDHGFSIDLSGLSTASHAITLTVMDNRTSDQNEVVFYDGFINNHAPTGAFEPITNGLITGWAFDQDAPGEALPVDMYIDGAYATTINANLSRSDVNTALGSPNHAFSVAVPHLMFGTHRIDLYAAESQGNVSVLIGSQVVTNARPIGAIESTTTTTITGWAADANTLGSSVQVQVFVNGQLAITGTANLSRPDLLTKTPLNTVPGYSSYGYSFSLPTLSVGRNQIDVYAVDPNNGMLSPLGSTSITIPALVP